MNNINRFFRWIARLTISYIWEIIILAGIGLIFYFVLDLALFVYPTKVVFETLIYFLQLGMLFTLLFFPMLIPDILTGEFFLQFNFKILFFSLGSLFSLWLMKTFFQTFFGIMWSLTYSPISQLTQLKQR